MAKFYRRKFYKSSSRDKYSVEHTNVFVRTAANTTAGLYQATQQIVPSAALGGMRKVKHLTISLTAGASANQVWWAIVYVPEGYNVNPLNGNTGASLYEPNQFVMACGVNDVDAGPIRIRSPISRNLNSGDSIWLVVGTPSANADCVGVCSYAITLQ